MKTIIAAVVVEYRAPLHTVKCVHALLNQGVEDIFVIDNSADGGVVFAELQKSLACDARVHLEDAGSNLGFAAGANLGIVRARSSSSANRVLLINNDAMPEQGMVAALADALEEDSHRLIAYPSLLHAGVPMHEVYYHRWLTTIGNQPRSGAFRLPRGCCMMIAIDRLPGPLFDETFFMYGEEIELGWRLRGQPGALCHVPSVVAVHEGSVGAKLGSPFYEERTAASHLILSRCLAQGSAESLLLALLRTPLIVFRSCVRAIRLRSLRPLAALPPAFRIASAALRQRESNKAVSLQDGPAD